MKNPFKRAPKNKATDPIVVLTQAFEGVFDILNGIMTRGVDVHHTVTHAPRPVPPRPREMTVIYEMQDGQQWRTYHPIGGMGYIEASWPSWLDPLVPGYEASWPPVKIRYEFGYDK
jgi:hypothetical protein